MNRKTSIIRKINFCVLGTFIAYAIINIMSAPALATSASEVMQKALINDMDYCYRGAALVSPLSEAGSMNFAFDLSAVLKPGGAFYLPTDIGNSVGTSSVSCKDVFLGKGSSMQSVYVAFGKSKPNTAEQMGYVASGDAGDTDPMRCLYLRYNLRHKTSSGYETVERNLESNSLCFFVESDGDTIKTVDANTIKTFDRDKQRKDLTGNIVLTANNACLYYTAAGVKTNECIVNGGRGFGGTKFSDLLSTFNTNASLMYAHEDYGGVAGNLLATTVDGNTEASAIEDTEHKNGSTAASLVIKSGVSNPIAVQNITGGVIGDYKFNDSDWYFIYRTYIDSLLSDSVAPISISNDCSPDNSSLTYAMTYDGTNWCSINGGENVTKQFAVRQDDVTLKLGSFSDVIRKMKMINFSNVSSDLLTGAPGDPMNGGSTDPGENPSDSDAASCFTDGDALGWILCPTIKMVGSATTAAYENIEQNWLQMDTSFFDSNKGTYDGWTQFRNYANILFSIGFVVIILAQVTGIGISNYNIKKLLPKLIMVVILVNLSFIICQIAVDISNILGSTLYDLFKGLKTGKSEAFGVGNLVVGLLSSIGTGALVGVGVAGITVAALTSPGAVLVPLLIAFIGALISLLFFFIILAVRKAGIVILVVLAPVAIVCYALPNTKSFFDRWKKLFMSLLMVYPICAVLMGGGYFASNLLLKNGDNGFVETLVALLLQVVPIFLVPGVLRSSLALAGNIGTKLSMMGSNLGRRTTGAIANAEMTKRAKTSMNYWGANTGQKALGKVGGAIGKIPGVGRAARAFGGTGIGKALKAGQTRRIAQNKMEYRKMRLDEGSNEYIAGTMTAQSIKNDLASQKYKQELERIDTTADSIITGNLSYTDGTGEHIVNANDVEKGGSLEQALEYYMNQYDTAVASGDEAAQEEMLTKARAVSKVMFEKGGDTGRSRVMHQLKRHAFDTTGAVDKKASFRGLTKYISQNDKWMGGLKAEDIGGHALVSEGANFTGDYGTPTHEGTFHSLMHYNTMGGGKVSTSAVPSLSDNFYEGYDDAATSGLYTVGSAAYNADVASGGHGARDLIQLAETLERAMADPTVAQKVKDKDLAKMETIHRQAYDLKRDQWLAANRGKTRADYEAQFGAYQKLVKGKALKISHAKMPTGWKRADSMDVARFRTLGLSEGDWFNNSGLGSKLSAEQIRKAEAIEQQHIDADIQNGL